MFSKSGDKPKAAPAPSAPTLNRGTPSAAVSRISGDMKVVGDVLGSGDLEIDGSVKGNVKSRGVTINQGGTVTGDIEAEAVRVHGSLTGRIRAEAITVSATARIKGELASRNLAIESGAVFEGQVRRLDDDKPKSSAMTSRTEAKPKTGEATNVPKMAAAAGQGAGSPGKMSTT